MERGAIGELIPKEGKSGEYSWFDWPDQLTFVSRNGELVAKFYGPLPIRLERVALFLTAEQS